MAREPDNERARMNRVFVRSALSFALSGAALALAIWSFLATTRAEAPCGAYEIGAMFPWGVAKPWRNSANAGC